MSASERAMSLKFVELNNSVGGSNRRCADPKLNVVILGKVAIAGATRHDDSSAAEIYVRMLVTGR